MCIPPCPYRFDDVLAEARDCFRAGAIGVHLHVRDDALDAAGPGARG
jgi:uncharacterized protein (DUF849 family)